MTSNDDVTAATAAIFEEGLMDLYAYGRKMMLLYRADSGDLSQTIPPEDFMDLPVDLRVEWIEMAGALGYGLTHLSIQLGEAFKARQ